MNSSVDAFPLWGHLQTPADQDGLVKLMTNLSVLTDLCRQRREVLVLGEEYEPDVLTQNMLRNCGCFETVMHLNLTLTQALTLTLTLT